MASHLRHTIHQATSRANRWRRSSLARWINRLGAEAVELLWISFGTRMSRFTARWWAPAHDWSNQTEQTCGWRSLQIILLCVRASDGQKIGTWTGATNAYGVVVAGGYVYVTGRTNPGILYIIDPSAVPGAAGVVSSTLGVNPAGIAYDGNNIWTANSASGPGTGSVSIFSLVTFTPTTVSTGFSQPLGILYDGAFIWITDTGDGTLKKLDESGSIMQTVVVGSNPQFPAFDGTNIWVPNIGNDTVTVVRASTGAVLATLSGNGLNSPRSVAFDGERILVTNSVPSVSIWKATDLSVIGAFSLGGQIPFAACSDGLNFWITNSG